MGSEVVGSAERDVMSEGAVAVVVVVAPAPPAVSGSGVRASIGAGEEGTVPV